MAAELDNFENRDHRAAVPFLPPVVLGTMAHLCGGLGNAFIAADGLFPALLLLLLYALTNCESFRWRLVVAWSTLIVSFGIQNSLWMGEDALTAPLEITRTPQPEFSFLLLLAAMALFARALDDNAKWRWAAAAGVLSAGVVYSYYFFALAWGGALLTAFFFGVLWGRAQLRKQAFMTLLIMGVLSIPYVLAGLHSQGQKDLLGRVGVFTRSPHVLKLIAAFVLALLIWRFGRKIADPVVLVMLLVILAAIAGLNAHVITGYETQPWHFWKRLALPLAFFLAVSLAGRIVEQLRFSRAIAAAILCVLWVDTAARLGVAGVRTAPELRLDNPRIALLNWIAKTLPQGRVIGTIDPQLILLIPTLTDDYTYVPSGIRSLTPTDEIKIRYYQLACLLGMTPAEVENAAAVPNHLGHSTEVLLALGLSPTGDPDRFHEFVGTYRSAYSRCPGIRYQLDYVVVASEAARQAVERKYANAREIYHNARFHLLAVRG